MFSIFLLESSYGISHIEDLSPLELIKVLDKLSSLSYTQKVDGANLIFGIDINGKFYTSREHKGDVRFYTSSEYPTNSKYDSFRAAHLALQKVLSKIKMVLQPGNAISIEVIMNNQPNVVSYGQNQIVFLEPVAGDDPSQPLDFSLIDNLNAKLRSTTVEIQSKVSNSDNGVSIIELPVSSKWIFHRSDKVNNKDIITDAVKNAIKDIKLFLKTKTNDITNLDIILSKSRDDKELKDKLKDELRNLVIDLKKLLLTDSLKTKLKQKDVSDGYFDGIEGIIATDTKTGEKFKIVDRDEFTEVNKFYYRYRDLIKSNVLTTDESAKMDSRGGLLGIAKTRCIQLFNIQGLELSTSKKRSLKMFGDKTQFNKNINAALSQLNYSAIKQKMLAIYKSTNKELSELLDTFKSEVDSKLKIKIKDKELKYTPEVKQKTLLAFANANNEIKRMTKSISKTKTIYDLFLVFFRDDINEIS